jgi:hypothetical protein
MIDPERDGRWYEERKRALVCAALGQRRYESAFEPACGYGALSRDLASRCTALLAVDSDEPSVRAAQEAYSGAARATFACARLPDAWPDGPFDLIVLSEWLYYLDDAAFDTTCSRVARTLSAEGDVIAVHWAQPIPESQTDAEAYHVAIGKAVGGHRFIVVRDDDFILDGWTRRVRTLAQLEGLR